MLNSRIQELLSCFPTNLDITVGVMPTEHKYLVQITQHATSICLVCQEGATSISTRLDSKTSHAEVIITQIAKLLLNLIPKSCSERRD